jgi:hypothetical protein
MTKLALVLVIACGYVVGRVAEQLLGLLFEWAGKVVGLMIAAAMKKMLATRQAQYEANQAALARQRSPLVVETGRTVNEDN